MGLHRNIYIYEMTQRYIYISYLNYLFKFTFIKEVNNYLFVPIPF